MLTRVLLLVQSHMKIALRTLLKNKLYSFIKIFGLAAGISSFAVLYGIVSVETGFDRGSLKLENVYRVLSVTGDEKNEEFFAKTPYLHAEILRKNFAENLVAVLRIFDYQLPLVPIAVEKNIHHEKRMLFVDENFFDFFDFTVLKKMPDKSLKDSSVVFISERLAKKYFRTVENALGKNLTYQYAVNLQIIGILADNQKPSHITSEIICSFSTLYTYPVMNRLENNFWNSCYTYVKLKPEIDKDIFEQKLNLFFSKAQNKRYTFNKIGLQSPAEIHLKSNFKDELNQNGHMRFVFILSSIGFLIALIAVINITNLTSARAAVRAKEVAVRKILGSNRTEIFFQILSESLILSTASVFLSLVFFEIFFRNLSRSLTNFLIVPSQDELILPIIASGYIFGLLSGIYPAIITAAFDPMDALRGKMIKTTGAHTIRKILIVIQTGITSFLLVVTTVNYTQVIFLRSKKLGFDKNDIFVVPIQHTQFFLAYDSFKNDLLAQKLALYVTAADAIVGKEHFVRPYKAGKDEKTMLFNEISVKPDFLETFRLKLIAGRNFCSDSIFFSDTLFWRKKLDFDDTTAVIVNREMTKFLGFERPDEALGYPLRSMSGNEIIVGVVENFHYKSLHEPMQPLVLDLPHGIRDNYLASRYLLLKMSDTRSENFLATERLWKKYLPTVPFEYFSLRSKLDELYLQEERLAKLASLFTELAILISCLGLFGMSSFLAALKRHEVGIRKALGAGFWEIYAIFAQYFIPLLLIGIITGNVFATIINFFWLNSFAFHVSFHFVPYAVSSLVVILIALLIVSFHAVRSALSNPVDDLNNFT